VIACLLVISFAFAYSFEIVPIRWMFCECLCLKAATDYAFIFL